MFREQLPSEGPKADTELSLEQQFEKSKEALRSAVEAFLSIDPQDLIDPTKQSWITQVNERFSEALVQHRKLRDALSSKNPN